MFVRDLETGTTTLVSINSAGSGSGNRGSFASNVRISGNGRFVAFESSATNFVSSMEQISNTYNNIFVRDLVARTTVLVSVNLAGTASVNNPSQYPAISWSESDFQSRGNLCTFNA